MSLLVCPIVPKDSYSQNHVKGMLVNSDVGVE